MATTWITCDVCGEEWTADAFTASGNAFTNRKRMCSACFLEMYPRRYVPCTGCGKRMSTRGKCAPMCRPCREHRRKPDTPVPPIACIDCGESLTDHPAQSNGRCYRCVLRRWRAKQGVNGKQTIGAWSHAA